MFLTAEDFNLLPFSIPNLSEDDGMGNTFAAFIDEQEESILRKILGTLLYESFISGLFDIGGNAVPEINIEQRWKDLRDGLLYVYKVKTYRYFGIKKILKGYIYAHWTKYQAENNSGIGSTISKSENSEVVQPLNQFVYGYNDYVKYLGSFNKRKNTLYGYLSESLEIYMDVLPNYSNIKNYLRTECIFPSVEANVFGL